MKKLNLTSLLISIVLAELIGMVSGLLAGDSGAAYDTLLLPPFSPPGWVFPIAWGILYALMGIAAFLIADSGAPNVRKRKALIFYIAQLTVNFLWSIVFFRFQLLWGSVAVILLLDVLVILTMIKFYRLRKTAMYFLIPYLLWILFATYLNIGTALLN